MATWNQGTTWKKKLTWMRNTKSVLDEVTTGLGYLNDSRPMTSAGLAVASGCTAKVAIAATYNLIDGSVYEKAAVAGQALSGSTVPSTKYGAFAFEIGTDGVVDLRAATANGTGYATSALALAGIPSTCASHSRLGTISVAAGATNFIPGTTKLTTCNATATFANATTVFNAIAGYLTTAVPATDI